MAVFRGDIHLARSTLEATAAGLDAGRAPDVQTWYAPNDPIAGMYSFLALARFLQGDLPGAEAALGALETTL